MKDEEEVAAPAAREANGRRSSQAHSQVRFLLHSSPSAPFFLLLLLPASFFLLLRLLRSASSSPSSSAFHARTVVGG